MPKLKDGNIDFTAILRLMSKSSDIRFNKDADMILSGKSLAPFRDHMYRLQAIEWYIDHIAN